MGRRPLHVPSGHHVRVPRVSGTALAPRVVPLVALVGPLAHSRCDPGVFFPQVSPPAICPPRSRDSAVPGLPPGSALQVTELGHGRW